MYLTDCGVADVGFLVDSSRNLRKEFFDKEKTFVKKIMRMFRITPRGSRAGLITFSDIADFNIKMNQHADTGSFLDAVSSIPFKGSSHRVDPPMTLAKSKLFKTNNGGRLEAKKILIIVTGTSRVSELHGNTGLEMKENTLVVVIGVGQGATKNQLDHMVGGSNMQFIAESFDALIGKRFVDEVLKEICVPLGMIFWYSFNFLV